MAIHATEFLRTIGEREVPPVVVVRGEDGALRHAVVSAIRQRLFEQAEPNEIRLDGREADYRTVHDELARLSMWGGVKLVLVEDAEKFLSSHRDQLADYLDAPARKAVLLLDVTTLDGRTRFAQRVGKRGLVVDCSPLKGGALFQWLRETARNRFGKQLSSDAAKWLVELVGNQLGQLEQELSKLASYTGDRSMIDAPTVRKLVGGWKAETTWNMLDALRDGRLDLALTDLQKLLNAGESPIFILGAIRHVCRKYVQAAERAREGVPLRKALADAGVFDYQLASNERYMRRVGRPRVEQMPQRLMQTELQLRGDSRLPERLILEQLILWLGGHE
ncbi:MAG: DNA polymerase III subunit delta [Planctomycetes bacterium]|nr:DNA polymerase III subunit delta [Planctomycetota bacterium]